MDEEARFLPLVCGPGVDRGGFVRIMATLIASSLRGMPTTLRDDILSLAVMLSESAPSDAERASLLAAPHDSAQAKRMRDALLPALAKDKS